MNFKKSLRSVILTEERSKNQFALENIQHVFKHPKYIHVFKHPKYIHVFKHPKYTTRV